MSPHSSGETVAQGWSDRSSRVSGFLIRGDHAALLEPVQDLQAGAMQPGLDGADRTFERLGDLLIRLPLLVKQYENCAVLDAQLGDSVLNFREQLIRIIRDRPGDGVLKVV